MTEFLQLYFDGFPFVDETVFEMKAQAQINLHEWIPAITSAQQCINMKPNWYIGHQTLGNTYEVRLLSVIK